MTGTGQRSCLLVLSLVCSPASPADAVTARSAPEPGIPAEVLRAAEELMAAQPLSASPCGTLAGSVPPAGSVRAAPWGGARAAGGSPTIGRPVRDMKLYAGEGGDTGVRT